MEIGTEVVKTATWIHIHCHFNIKPNSSQESEDTSLSAGIWTVTHRLWCWLCAPLHHIWDENIISVLTFNYETLQIPSFVSWHCGRWMQLNNVKLPCMSPAHRADWKASLGPSFKLQTELNLIRVKILVLHCPFLPWNVTLLFSRNEKCFVTRPFFSPALKRAEINAGSTAKWIFLSQFSQLEIFQSFAWENTDASIEWIYRTVCYGKSVNFTSSSSSWFKRLGHLRRDRRSGLTARAHRDFYRALNQLSGSENGNCRVVVPAQLTK